MLQRLWRPAALALVAIVVLVVGLWIDPAQAECGSREMTPGQICDIVGKGGPVRKTYDDVVAERQLWRIGLQAGGAVLIVGAGAWVVLALRGARRHRRGDAASTRTPPPASGVPGPARTHSAGAHPGPAQPPSSQWFQPASQQPEVRQPASQAPGVSAPGAWQHASGAATVPRRRASAPAPRSTDPASQDTPPRAPRQPRRWQPQHPSPPAPPRHGGPPQPRG